MLAMQQRVRKVRVDPTIAEYIVRIVENARNDARLRLAISTRGSLTLFRASQAQAMLDGRDFVTPDDVRSLAVPVLAHRVALDTKAKYGGVRNESVIEEALEKTAVPR